MSKKWKIFGYQTNTEWYDIKTRIKALLRKITYSWLFQELLCLVFLSYMRLVFYSSKKIFINEDSLLNASKNKTPLIIIFWHNRLLLAPFASKKSKKLYPDYSFMTLASRHGDGRFVGRIMEKFGLISILGSSRGGRKASRGIDIGSFKRIFEGLKKSYCLIVTPDGPRGPNQKINGEILNIARIAQVGILASSCSASKFKTINTWDQFKIPLPFSTICYYLDEKPFYIPKDTSREQIEKIKIEIEERMNFLQEKSLEIAQKKQS
ncbi:MAG: DUF374 domain-containing protein [Proteobacteria bacterium]|nr:DUF374 domain-containing protein [Pseudomonadota bacterium]